MSEETTLDTGSQEVAEAVAAQPVMAEPVAAQPAEAPAPQGSWLDGLSESHKANPLINKFQSADDFATSYVHAQRLIGADKIPVPGKHATDDEWRAVYQKLGAPNDPTQYEFEKTQVFDDASFDAFRNKAYELGLTNKQAREIAGLYEQQINMGRDILSQRAEEARFNGEQELRREFGDYFEQRLDMARAAASTVVENEDIFALQLADGRMLGDHPQIVRAFSKMAEMLGEDSLVGETTEVIMSAAEAKRRYDEVVAQGSPWWNKFHPEHQSYVDEAVHLRSYFSG